MTMQKILLVLSLIELSRLMEEPGAIWHTPIFDTISGPHASNQSTRLDQEVPRYSTPIKTNVEISNDFFCVLIFFGSITRNLCTTKRSEEVLSRACDILIRVGNLTVSSGSGRTHCRRCFSPSAFARIEGEELRKNQCFAAITRFSAVICFWFRATCAP